MNPALTLDEAKDIAHKFVRGYAEDHELFSSEAVCDAYKAAGLPVPPDKGWRDRWGAVMSRAAKANIIEKVGKITPTSGSTHMNSTVQWRSRVYKGEYTAIETGKDRIEDLRRSWINRDIKDIRALLWQAYEFGYAQASAGKEKLKNG
jgi:hypothetical protein